MLDAIGDRVRMRASGEWRCLVEQLPGEGDDLGAAHWIVRTGASSTAFIGNGVRAVERIVERAPAGVGRVQRIPRVHHWNDELRAGDRGDLGIDVGGVDLEVGALRLEVADLGEERLVGFDVERLSAACLVPAVDLRLQLVTDPEQVMIHRREIVQQRVEARPEAGCVHAGAGKHLLLDEVVKYTGHANATVLHMFRHSSVFRGDECNLRSADETQWATKS